MIRLMEVPIDARKSAALLVSNAVAHHIFYIPCSENFDKATTAAVRTLLLLCLSSLMIPGMEVPIDARNSAALMIRRKEVSIDARPCSESFDKATTAAVRTLLLLCLSNLMIRRMEVPIDARNSAA
jgi:hypothetical protein